MTAYMSVVAAPSTQGRWIIRPATVAAIVLLATAVLLRRGQFGNAIAGLDEQFYLLAGDRLWAGELPYIDLWDRKPFGLFLLFAAIRMLPGDGVLAAQLVATVFAAATAWVVALLAHRGIGWRAATMGGMFYLAGQIELWGDTTQTPVFYNLPVAVAAWLTLRAARDPLAVGARRHMALAMLLVGLAMQLKTNALLEGACFALWYLWSVHRAGAGTAMLTRTGAMLAVVGAVPTIAAMAFYGAIGALPSWWQANVLSVIAKGRPGDAAVGTMLGETVVLIAPILLLAIFGLWATTRRFSRWSSNTSFLLGWIVVTLGDLAAIGGYYPHYALPLLLAASPLIAHGLAVRRVGVAVFAAAMAWPLVHTQVFMPHIGTRERMIANEVVAAIPADVRTRCMFIFEGPVAYYHLTGACRVTRYAFSAHLSSRREQAALGVDPRAELDAAMAKMPGTVITVDAPARPDRAIAMERRLLTVLDRDYVVTARLAHRHFTPDERLVIWRRR